MDLGDDFRTTFETDVPTLVVHGDWDLSTPYQNAVVDFLRTGSMEDVPERVELPPVNWVVPAELPAVRSGS